MNNLMTNYYYNPKDEPKPSMGLSEINKSTSNLIIRWTNSNYIGYETVWVFGGFK